MTDKAPMAKVLEIDNAARSIIIDGEPLPWLIRDWRVNATADGIKSLTIEIPVETVLIDSDH